MGALKLVVKRIIVISELFGSEKLFFEKKNKPFFIKMQAPGYYKKLNLLHLIYYKKSILKNKYFAYFSIQIAI